MMTFAEHGCAKVLVVGDAMLDRYWFGDVSRISPEAPVPVVRIERSEQRLGGAANVARNVNALGEQAIFLSVIGEDEDGSILSELLARSSVEASLHVDKELSTTTKLRVIGRHQQLLRIDFEDEPSKSILDLKFRNYERLLPSCDVVVFSDYGKGCLTHVKAMIDMARKLKIPVLVDPKGTDYSRYRGSTVITPNRAELCEIIGPWLDENDLGRKANALRREMEFDWLLLTRSEDGMSLFSAGEPVHEAAIAREVFDVSGAGDTVIATLAVMMARGFAVGDAMRLANRAASVVVGKLGTATCSIDELRQALRAGGSSGLSC